LDWTVYRNGSLWTAQTIFMPATGTPNRCSVQWWQVDTTAGDVGGIQQLGRIDDPTATLFYAYSSIGVNSESDALVGYSQFSATQYAGSGSSLRMAGDAPSTLRAGIVLEAGQASYFKDQGAGDNRWGDFSSTVVDPLNDLNLWTLQEYAATDNDWGTWWGEVPVGGATSTSTPSPTPTAKPSPTSTPTATPTAKPSPTSTPTATPTAKPSPTSTPVPTATPTPTLTIGSTTLPDGTVGVFYYAPLQLSGGTPPYLVLVSAGALPRGLSLNTFNGVISGTPAGAGLSLFTVNVTDRGSASASEALQIQVSITP
jgi:hypothetical protein